MSISLHRSWSDNWRWVDQHSVTPIRRDYMRVTGDICFKRDDFCIIQRDDDQQINVRAEQGHRLLEFTSVRQSTAYLLSIALGGLGFQERKYKNINSIPNTAEFPESFIVGLAAFTSRTNVCAYSVDLGRLFNGDESEHFQDLLNIWLKKDQHVQLKEIMSENEVTIYEAIIDDLRLYYLTDGTANPAICSNTISGLAIEYKRHRVDLFANLDSVPDRIRALTQSFKEISLDRWKSLNDDNPIKKVDEEISVILESAPDQRAGYYNYIPTRRLTIRYEQSAFLGHQSRIERPLYLRYESVSPYSYNRMGSYKADPSFDSNLEELIAKIMNTTRRVKAMYEGYYDTLIKLIGFRPYMEL